MIAFNFVFILATGVSDYDRRLFDLVANYSIFGRQQHAQDFQQLSSDTFADLVITPLGISCPAGGKSTYAYRVIDRGDFHVMCMYCIPKLHVWHVSEHGELFALSCLSSSTTGIKYCSVTLNVQKQS